VIFLIPIEFENLSNYVTAFKVDPTKVNPLFEVLKSSNTLFVFSVIACLYIMGHLIQAIDMVRYKLVKKFFYDHATEPGVNGFIYRTGMGGRVAGALLSQYLTGVRPANKDSQSNQGLIDAQTYEKQFWEKAVYLQVKGQYTYSNYWYVVKDLLNGLETVLIILSFYSFFLFFYIKFFNTISYWPWDKLCIFGIYCFFTFVFWVKAKVLSEAFIESVVTTHKILLEEPTSEKDKVQKSDKSDSTV
jgi:hypothetical protein